MSTEGGHYVTSRHYNKKTDHIRDLTRELKRHKFSRVRAVWVFAMNYLPIIPEAEDDPELIAQQNTVFVEQVGNRRKPSNCVDFSECPDLITDVLDRPRTP